MSGWLAQVHIPVVDLGRVRLPKTRMRFRGGFVRVGFDARREHVVATLEDRDGRVIASPTQTEACARAAVMGQAIAVHLMRANKFQAGEDPGRHDQIRVAMA